MAGYSGIYNPDSPPARAGMFILAETVETPRPRAGSNGVVAIIGEADWGPHNEIVEITSPNQATSMFGTTGTLNFAITQALMGEGRPDRSGAATVKAYRIAGTAIANATLTLSNTTPASALTITAKYAGTRGNALRITTQTNPIDSAKRDLIVYEGTTKRESYTYNGTGATILAALAADINTNSKFITATVVLDGLPLAAVANSALTGGNSGTSILAAQHTDAQAAFEADSSFSVIALDDWASLDSGIQSSYRDWMVRIVEEGTLAHMVVGGLVGESVSTATARSVTLDTPDANHVKGVGEIFVNLTRDLEINSITYSSSEMAPRVAGILASADAFRSIVGATITDARLVNPPATASVETLVRSGVIPFVYDGTNVALQRDVTTYGQAVAPTADKAKQFQELAFVRRLWFTFRELGLVYSRQIQGTEIRNTDSSRETIVGMFNAKLVELEELDHTVPGATVVLDPDADNTGSSISLLFTYRPSSSISQVLARLSIPV